MTIHKTINKSALTVSLEGRTLTAPEPPEAARQRSPPGRLYQSRDGSSVRSPAASWREPLGTQLDLQQDCFTWSQFLC